ncbi:MAG: TldD/PmbA family protein [Chloroflexi bacterium]|nr:TldD/PmbA family protein [Chloroflexota bacterium]
MQELLSLARKHAEQAEVYYAEVEESSVGFEANRVKKLTSRQRSVTALRIVKNGRIGIAMANQSDRTEELVGMAVQVSEFGATAAFELPGPQPLPETQVMDKNITGVSLERMIGIGEEVISRVTSHTPALLVEGRVGKSISTVRLINSRGAESSYSKSVMTVMMEGTLVKDTDLLFVEEMDVSCRPISGGRHISDSMIEQLERSRETASVASGKLPVVFLPRAVAGSMLFALAQAFNGRVVFQGASPVANKLGQKVFDKKVKIWDDPTIAFRPGSRPFDDEGMPSQRNSLIEDGVVSHFIYDLQTAGLAKTKSTGNGSRMGGGVPAPAISALVIQEGDVAVNDLIGDINEGLVVDSLMGAEQGNTLGGDFSGNVLLGFKVENGKLVGRVKDTMVSGNIYDILQDITLANDARWIGGMLRSPSIFLPRLAVSSKH